MKTLIIYFIFIGFSLYSHGQDRTETFDSNILAVSYSFCSQVKKDTKIHDTSYCREVEVYGIQLSDKVRKYDFFCTKFDFNSINNISYIKKVAYVFDEISLLTDENGQITDLTKPDDMDERWEKTKQKLLLEYKGKLITEYLEEVDKVIKDKQNLIDFLQSDNMYGLFLKALSERDQPAKTTRIRTTDGVSTITPKTPFKDQSEQYIFTGTTLKSAVKRVGNTTYEIKFSKQINP